MKVPFSNNGSSRPKRDSGTVALWEKEGFVFMRGFKHFYKMAEQFRTMKSVNVSMVEGESDFNLLPDCRLSINCDNAVERLSHSCKEGRAGYWR